MSLFDGPVYFEGLLVVAGGDERGVPGLDAAALCLAADLLAVRAVGGRHHALRRVRDAAAGAV